MAKKISIVGYACEKCGKAYHYDFQANECCEEYFCTKCGVKVGKYQKYCDDCKEKIHIEKAKKMTYEEYIEKYRDNMFVHNDEYYSEIEDVIDNCESFGEKYPKYVWGNL